MCPNCKREYGSLRKKVVKRNQRSMSLYRVKNDDYGEEQKTWVKRNFHANKFATLFGIGDQYRKPIINPPEPSPDESRKVLMETAEKMIIAPVVLFMVLPYIIEKYPELSTKKQDFVRGLKVIEEYMIPLRDGRWDRSLAEWQEVAKFAKDYGYNAASRKFPSIKDGKQHYLSPSHLKQKLRVVDNFNKKIQKVIPATHEYLKLLQNIIKEDSEIKEKYTRLIKNYHENKEHITNQIYKSSISSKIYSYTYYYIRHYDPKIYRQKKSDCKRGLIKKSQITGKVECGPFKEEKIPNKAIDKLRLQTQNKVISLYSRILFTLSLEPFTDLSVQSIIGSETKDTIKSMLEELRSLGLVTSLNYSDYKSEMGIGKDNNLYYLLNWSSPKSKMMLADYKKRSTKKEILNITKKVAEYSASETRVSNIVGVKRLSTNVEEDRNSIYCTYAIERAKSYEENRRPPLLALIDLKKEGIFLTKLNYIDAWEAMEEAEVLLLQ